MKLSKWRRCAYVVSKVDKSILIMFWFFISPCFWRFCLATKKCVVGRGTNGEASGSLMSTLLGCVTKRTGHRQCDGNQRRLRATGLHTEHPKHAAFHYFNGTKSGIIGSVFSRRAKEADLFYFLGLFQLSGWLVRCHQLFTDICL